MSPSDLQETIPVTDSELLMRFTRHRDEEAFRLLVERYAGLVSSVCRQVLGNSADAEDAFQATFLILTRRAGRLLDSHSIAGWLHKVAYRAALKAARQRSRQRQAMQTPEPASAEDVFADIQQRDAIEILNAEIARLPRRYRDALVLCHLEGLSRQQAAQALDCTEASVKALLTRGRKQLRYRMLRRGVALSAAVILCQQISASTATAATVELVESTVGMCMSHQAAGLTWPQIPQAVKNLVSQTEKTTMLSLASKPAAAITLTLVCLAAPLVILAQSQDPDSTAPIPDTFTFDGDLPGIAQQSDSTPATIVPQAGPTRPAAPQQQQAPPGTPARRPAGPLPPIAGAPRINPLAQPPIAGVPQVPAAVPEPAAAPSVPTYSANPFAPSVPPMAPRVVRDTEDIQMEMDELQMRREYYNLRMRGLEQMAAAKERMAQSVDAPESNRLKAESTLLQADAMLAHAESLGVERQLRMLQRELDASETPQVDALAPIPGRPAPPPPVQPAAPTVPGRVR